MRIAIRKAEYFIPSVVMLKALLDVSDRAIYDHLVATAVAEDTVDRRDPSQQQKADPFVADRVEIMLRTVRKDLGLSHHEQCLAHLGSAYQRASTLGANGRSSAPPARQVGCSRPVLDRSLSQPDG